MSSKEEDGPQKRLFYCMREECMDELKVVRFEKTDDRARRVRESVEKVLAVCGSEDRTPYSMFCVLVDDRGVCWNQTSVSSSPWWICDDDEGRPYDVERGDGRWWFGEHWLERWDDPREDA